MRARFARFALLSCSIIAVGLVGCADARPKQALRSDAASRELINPGMFGDNAPADRRRSYFDFWNEQIVRQNVAVGTVFMGDSITERWELGAYFVPSNGMIANRGIGGDTAACMAKRFAADVLQLRPRNVVILAGINDVSRQHEKGVPDDQIVQSVVESLTAMMDASRAAGVHTMVCSILPTNSDCREHNNKKAVVPRINAILKQLCAAKGCVYVDYCARLSDASGELPRSYARDGLHPHYAGYAIMADALRQAARNHGIIL
jgi:lysophospholipase L1-like esterase